MNSNEEIISDDVLLLAFAASELEGKERVHLESRLAADSSLRDRLEKMRQDYEHTMQMVATLDQQYHFNEQKSLAPIQQLMLQWENEHTRIPAPIILHHWRPPAWSYAAAAVVLLLIGFCFWWANNPAVSPIAEVPATSPVPQTLTMESPTSNTLAETASAALPLAFQDNSSEDSERLTNLEHDVVALSDSSLSANSLGDNNQ